MEEQGQQDQNENKMDKDVNEPKQSQDTSKTEPGVSLVAEKKEHTCTKCFKTFGIFYSLKCHRLSCRKIDKKYKCSHCDIGFGQAMHLQNHIDGHTGVRPYHCPTCERSYRHKATLTEHLQSHSEENSYKCKLCNKVFQRYGTLKRHEFLHTGKKPFKCLKCEATFAFKDYLAVHVRKHAGVKRKTCPQCGKGLSDHNSLRRHTIAVHSESLRGETPSETPSM